MTTAFDLTLAEAVDQIYYGANCQHCRDIRRVDLQKVLAELGPDAHVRDIRPRLRCQVCDGKDIIVVTLWQSATTAERMMEGWK